MHETNSTWLVHRHLEAAGQRSLFRLCSIVVKKEKKKAKSLREKKKKKKKEHSACVARGHHWASRKKPFCVKNVHTAEETKCMDANVSSIQDEKNELRNERKIRKEKERERETVRNLSNSNVHVVVLLVCLAVEWRLLAGRLLDFQCRLSQSVLLYVSCRLRGQNHVLEKRRWKGKWREKGSPVELIIENRIRGDGVICYWIQALSNAV